jgi:hypothetical protein
VPIQHSSFTYMHSWYILIWSYTFICSGPNLKKSFPVLNYNLMFNNRNDYLVSNSGSLEKLHLVWRLLFWDVMLCSLIGITVFWRTVLLLPSGSTVTFIVITVRTSHLTVTESYPPVLKIEAVHSLKCLQFYQTTCCHTPVTAMRASNLILYSYVLCMSICIAEPSSLSNAIDMG